MRAVAAAVLSKSWRLSHALRVDAPCFVHYDIITHHRFQNVCNAFVPNA